MSESIVYAKNIVTQEVNGVQGQIIDPDLNTPGQILTITSTDPKSVAFQDPPEGTPSAVGFPDGYVLKIVDNTTNTINWETDALGPGPVVPLVLTGDNVNALKVQDNALNTKLNVDTIGDSVTINGSNINLESSDIVSVDGVNQALLQTASASVIINGADTTITSNNTEINNVGSLRITGTSAKGKVEVKTGGTNDTIFKIDTNGDVGNVAILGPNTASKFAVLNGTSDRILDVDTSVDKLSTAGKLLVEGNNEVDKFSINQFGGASFLNADTSSSTFTLGSAGDVTTIEPLLAKTTISGTTGAPTLLLNNFTTGSQLEFQAIGNFIAPENRIFSTNPLDMDITGKLSIITTDFEVSSNTSSSITANNGANALISSDGVQFTQFTVDANTGALLLIEDIIAPTKNHLEISYNSIVSKGNPLSQTSTIDMYPATDDVSFHRRNQDQISVYANPVSDAINFPLTLTLTTDSINWTEIPFTTFSWTSTIGSNFVIEPITNRIQYTGVISRTFMIVFEICADTSATDQMVQLCMYKTNTTGIIPTNELEAESFGCFLTKDNPKTGGTCLSFKLVFKNTTNSHIYRCITRHQNSSNRIVNN
jgi:hypothetical protein